MACLCWSLAYSLAHILSSLLPPSPHLPRLPFPLPLLLLLLHTTVLLSCLPLLLGILLPRPLLLLPWLFSSCTTTTVEASSDIFLVHLTPFASQPVTAFVFTLTFFLLCLQVNPTQKIALSINLAGVHHLLHHLTLHQSNQSLPPTLPPSKTSNYHETTTFCHTGGGRYPANCVGFSKK